MSYQPFPAFTDWAVQFDPSAVDRYAERLQRAKASASEEAQRRALEIATRYAAVDTGALEGLYTTDRGFTRTIATQSEFWQRALALKGEQARRSIEDALAAYDYVLDAVTGSAPITEKWIRELHSVITEHQGTLEVVVVIGEELRQEHHPLAHGEYKTFPNNPISRSTGRMFYYAPPEDTSSEMARLIGELRSDAFAHAHPVVQAAYAHYAYIRIHPFSDGNGRVARALASVYLYRKPGAPLVIFADQRDSYVDALEAADAGRPAAFVEFIAQRVIDTVNSVTDSLETRDDDDSADVAELVAATRHWLSEDLALAAQRLQNVCFARLSEEIAAKNLPTVLQATVDGGNNGNCAVPSGYAIAGPFAWINLSAVTEQSTGQRHCFSHVVAAATEPGRAELLVAPRDSEGVSLGVWRREIEPAETTAFRLRLDAWAVKVAQRFVKQLSVALSQESGSQ